MPLHYKVQKLDGILGIQIENLRKIILNTIWQKTYQKTTLRDNSNYNFSPL